MITVKSSNLTNVTDIYSFRTKCLEVLQAAYGTEPQRININEAMSRLLIDAVEVAKLMSVKETISFVHEIGQAMHRASKAAAIRGRTDG